MVASRIAVVRVYEDPGRGKNEHRVLVDRLWPRGLTRASIDFDEWVKDVAPSSDLRRWYAHDPSRFADFSRRYRAELTSEPGASAVARLRKLAASRQLVLLTATRDVEHSGAAVLRDVISEPPRHAPPRAAGPSRPWRPSK